MESYKDRQKPHMTTITEKDGYGREKKREIKTTRRVFGLRPDKDNKKVLHATDATYERQSDGSLQKIAGARKPHIGKAARKAEKRARVAARKGVSSE